MIKIIEMTKNKNPHILNRLLKKNPVIRAGIATAVSLLAIVGFLLTSTPLAHAASCVPPATTYGTDTMSVQQPTTTTYTIWVRVQTPSATSASPLMLQTGTGSADSNPTCFNVGGSSTIPANTWTWVNAGSASLSAYSATAANQTQLELIGTQSGVEVDNVLLLTNSSCVPSGTGTNCTTGQPTPTAPTNVKATANSPTSVTVNWTGSTAGGPGLGVGGYYVYRNGTTTPIATINSPTTTTYTDTTVSGATRSE